MRLTLAFACVVILLALYFALLGAAAYPAQIEPVSLHYADSTAYCLHGTMADGTQTRRRSAAMNTLPLHSIIWIRGKRPGPHGLRIWYIRDRIGWGTQLDFWTPTYASAIRFGRHTMPYRILRRGDHGWTSPEARRLVRRYV